MYAFTMVLCIIKAYIPKQVVKEFESRVQPKQDTLFTILKSFIH